MNVAVTAVEGFPSRRVSRERLVTALIFALLAHGLVLLGVGFVALAPAPAPRRAVAVTLVNGADAAAPRKSAYLAQANQHGPGNAHRHAPPAAAGNPFPAPEPALAESFAAHEAGARELVSAKNGSRTAASGTPAAAGRPLLQVGLSAARAFGDVAVTTPRLPRLYGARPKADAHKVNARAAVSASYLVAWRRRIERIGSAQFARLVPTNVSRGHLTLSVTLNADGDIRTVEILKRSRHPELDAAALKIIRLAAPFPPFSPALRARESTLTLTYRWNFIRGGAGAGTVGLGGG